MSRYKKIVFIIVEGESEYEALSSLFNRIYDRNIVHIEIMHKDVTSDYRIKPTQIESYLGNILRHFANSSYVKQNDFLEVIHIIDMDGAYISDEYIIEKRNTDKTIYSIENIITDDIKKISDRNAYKRLMINKLSTLEKVWKNIPYKAYYMSCNLDHVLYDKQNSNDDEKELNAHNFAKKYKDDLTGFLSFISCSDFSVMTDFKESWLFIKLDRHSLERHTNLCICFKEISKEISGIQDEKHNNKSLY